MRTIQWALVCLIGLALSTWCAAQESGLQWRSLPALPDELGLAGPVVGVTDEWLVAAGGANFDRPVWENSKKWRDQIYVLNRKHIGAGWQMAGKLISPRAYAACASTPHGIAIIGGNDQEREKADCCLLKVSMRDGQPVGAFERLPDLPQPLVYAQAVWIQNKLVVLSGQTGSGLASAVAGGWSLSWSDRQRDVSKEATWSWQPIKECPGGPRAFAMVSPLSLAAAESRMVLMGGRRQLGDSPEFLRDVWQYDIRTDQWHQLADLPVPVSAGGAGCLGSDQIAVLSGDDGSLFTQTDSLKDNHPGFAKRTWLLQVAQNSWLPGGASPANQVTTPPLSLEDRIILVSGEIRPRVRTNQVWEIKR